jgi:hypothetical protein
VTHYPVQVDSAGGGDVALLQEDLIDVMPAVEEANSIRDNNIFMIESVFYYDNM